MPRASEAEQHDAAKLRVLRWRLPNGRQGKTAPLAAHVVAETLRHHRGRPNGIALWAVDLDA